MPLLTFNQYHRPHTKLGSVGCERKLTLKQGTKTLLSASTTKPRGNGWRCITRIVTTSLTTNNRSFFLRWILTHWPCCCWICSPFFCGGSRRHLLLNRKLNELRGAVEVFDTAVTSVPADGSGRIEDLDKTQFDRLRSKVGWWCWWWWWRWWCWCWYDVDMVWMCRLNSFVMYSVSCWIKRKKNSRTMFKSPN